MFYALILLIVYLAAALETALVDAVAISGIMPSPLALVAGVWLLSDRRSQPLLGVAAIGMVGDLLVPGHIGPGAAAWLLVGGVFDWLRPRLPLQSLAARTLALVVVIMAWGLLVVTVQGLLGELGLPLTVAWARAVGTGLYTALVGLPILLLVGRWRDRATDSVLAEVW